jgi:hypothetical protein
LQQQVLLQRPHNLCGDGHLVQQLLLVVQQYHLRLLLLLQSQAQQPQFQLLLHCHPWQGLQRQQQLQLCLLELFALLLTS